MGSLGLREGRGAHAAKGPTLSGTGRGAVPRHVGHEVLAVDLTPLGAVVRVPDRHDVERVLPAREAGVGHLEIIGDFRGGRTKRGQVRSGRCGLIAIAISTSQTRFPMVVRANRILPPGSVSTIIKGPSPTWTDI